MGKTVHDMDGMSSKSRVPIDYIHDDGDVIGYANKFNSEDGNLNVSGALVPYKDSDRASEIIHKAKSGIPYEASINFGGGKAPRIEEVPEGETVEVNGRTFAGPLTIFREWTLRGVAVCPYGYDGGTSTTFSQDQTIKVEIMDKDQTQEANTDTAVDSELALDTAEVPTVEADEVVASEATELAEPETKPEGQRFLDAFGERGGVWFAQGKSFAEATELHAQSQAETISKLTAEVEELQKKLDAKQTGEDEPVEFSEASTEEKLSTPMGIRIAGKAY